MDLRNVKPDDVRASAAEASLDAACLRLQRAAGIDDGGGASICLDPATWAASDADERRRDLTLWLIWELSHAEGHPPIRFVVRDVATGGSRRFAWGDGDWELGQEMFVTAWEAGHGVELAMLDPDRLDLETLALVAATPPTRPRVPTLPATVGNGTGLRVDRPGASPMREGPPTCDGVERFAAVALTLAAGVAGGDARAVLVRALAMLDEREGRGR